MNAFDNEFDYLTASRALHKQFAAIGLAVAKAEASALRDRLAGQGRTGRKHAGLPYRSSAATVPAGQHMQDRVPLTAEFPTEQTSDLLSSVDVWLLPEGVYAVGLHNTNIGKATALEMGSSTVPARAPLTRTARDPRIKKAANQATADAIRETVT